jgi:hypothetical protein
LAALSSDILPEQRSSRQRRESKICRDSQKERSLTFSVKFSNLVAGTKVSVADYGGSGFHIAARHRRFLERRVWLTFVFDLFEVNPFHLNLRFLFDLLPELQLYRFAIGNRVRIAAEFSLETSRVEAFSGVSIR